MIEATSRRMEFTHFNLDYSQMLAAVMQHKPSSIRRVLTSRPPWIDVLAGISLTSAGKSHSFNFAEGMLRPQQPPLFLRTSPLAARAWGGELCSNFINYKPQADSRQQHLALYMNRHLSLVAIMIKVTNRHTKCTHFKLDYIRIFAIALQW